jgi:hypothetical protein
MKGLVVLLLFFEGVSFLGAQHPGAFIREARGTVELKLSGSADWIPCKAGDPVPAAAVIATGFKSTALLAIGNSTVTIRPLTCLNMETLLAQGETEQVQLGLRTGRIRADVRPPAGGSTDFSVRSPIATASVRGTVFEFDTMNLRVTEGVVGFAPVSPWARASFRPVLVNRGESSWAAEGSGRAVPPAAAAEIRRLLPALPGRNAVSGADEIPKVNPQGLLPPGALAVDVTLEPK